MGKKDDDCALAAAAFLVFSSEEAKAICTARRSQRRRYLIRADLLPDPQGATPWQILYGGRNDRAFITTMGLDTITFQDILNKGFEELWNSYAITRADIASDATPRAYRRSLDAPGALGLILHWLSSTMHDVSLCEIFALTPVTVSQYIIFSLQILLNTLHRMEAACIRWPIGDEFQELNGLIIDRHPLLTGAFGSMDGLNLPVQTSSDENIENATYNGWLHSHCVSSIFVFAADGAIIACNLNVPGSWHDSRVAQPIYDKLKYYTPEGYYLVADTAFPCGSLDIEGKIHVPLKDGAPLPQDYQERKQLVDFTHSLTSYRQTVEWGMRALQGSFSRLRIPLSINYSEFRGDILEVVSHLHNVHTHCVGINQIRSIYMPLWNDEEEFWIKLGSLQFSEQRRDDRVHRFHITASEEV
ncbi:hypothetical protein AN958_06372 [Leucoagaricus sp. SymC.cos]|nr:hypothetical protein AN958_06372 [Leucoagaricus sp. SymC.cos]